MSISSDDDTDSSESDGEYDSEHDSDVYMHMENDVHAPDGIDLHGDVDMERDGDNTEEDDEQEEDEEKEDEEEEDEEQWFHQSKRSQSGVGLGPVQSNRSVELDRTTDWQSWTGRAWSGPVQGSYYWVSHASYIIPSIVPSFSDFTRFPHQFSYSQHLPNVYILVLSLMYI